MKAWQELTACHYRIVEEQHLEPVNGWGTYYQAQHRSRLLPLWRPVDVSMVQWLFGGALWFRHLQHARAAIEWHKANPKRRRKVLPA